MINTALVFKLDVIVSLEDLRSLQGAGVVLGKIVTKKVFTSRPPLLVNGSNTFYLDSHFCCRK